MLESSEGKLVQGSNMVVCTALDVFLSQAYSYRGAVLAGLLVRIYIQS